MTLSSSAAAWPLGALAEQPTRRPRLGILIYSTPERDPNAQSFLRGLRDLGYIDGENIGIEYRFAEGKASARTAAVLCGAARLEWPPRGDNDRRTSPSSSLTQ